MDIKTRNRKRLQSRNTTLKKCPRCSKPKPLSEFYKIKSNKDGYDGFCKKHRCEATGKYHKAHPDKQRLWSALNRAKNRAAIAETGKPLKDWGKKHRCPHCKQPRFIDEFPANPSRSSGRDSWCKYCIAPFRRSRSRRWYNANKLYVNTIRDPLRRQRVKSNPILTAREDERVRDADAAWMLRQRGL